MTWLHENHFLYFLQKLNSDDKTVDYLKSICREAEVDLGELWGVPVKGDEWMREHMADIKTPIFVRTNNVNQRLQKANDYLQMRERLELPLKLKENAPNTKPILLKKTKKKKEVVFPNKDSARTGRSIQKLNK